MVPLVSPKAHTQSYRFSRLPIKPTLPSHKVHNETMILPTTCCQYVYTTSFRLFVGGVQLENFKPYRKDTDDICKFPKIKL